MLSINNLIGHSYIRRFVQQINSGTDTFELYSLGSFRPTDIAPQPGWLDYWSERGLFTGLQGFDKFENYEIQSPITESLDNGDSFSINPWFHRLLYNRSFGYDNFESYDIQDPIVDTLNEPIIGNGGDEQWTSAWAQRSI
jgi:hypothetical protein